MDLITTDEDETISVLQFNNELNQNTKTCSVLTFDLHYNVYISILCEVNGEGKVCSFLVDTQADISVLKTSPMPDRANIDKTNVINIKGITNDSLKSLGTLHITIFMENESLDHEFHVVCGTR